MHHGSSSLLHHTFQPFPVPLIYLLAIEVQYGLPSLRHSFSLAPIDQLQPYCTERPLHCKKRWTTWLLSSNWAVAHIHVSIPLVAIFISHIFSHKLNWTPSLDWCEANYDISIILARSWGLNIWLAEWWNCWSNVPFVLLALWGVYSTRQLPNRYVSGVRVANLVDTS